MHGQQDIKIQAEKSVGLQQKCLIELALLLDLVSPFTLIKNAFKQTTCTGYQDQCRLLQPLEWATYSYSKRAAQLASET